MPFGYRAASEVFVATAPSPFTPEQQTIFDAECEKIFARFPKEQRAAGLIPVMRVAQGLIGWLPEEALTYVADVVGVPQTRVREVATFYTLFHLKPVGKNHVQICTNLSCWLAGSDKLYERVKERFGTEPRQPTPDGKFSVCEVECLASCGTAPALRINDQYYENVTAEQLDSILDELERS